MSKIKIKSVFERIAEKVFAMRDINSAKVFINEFISSTEINEIDKKIILNNVNECKYIQRLQTYICNSLLKYEGMSVNK